MCSWFFLFFLSLLAPGRFNSSIQGDVSLHPQSVTELNVRQQQWKLKFVPLINSCWGELNQDTMRSCSIQSVFVYRRLGKWTRAPLHPPPSFPHSGGLTIARRGHAGWARRSVPTAPRGARHLSAGTNTSERRRGAAGEKKKKKEEEKKKKKKKKGGTEPGNVSKQMRADCGLGSFLR